MLLLQNLVDKEQKATQYGKNLQLVCVWWRNYEHGDFVSVTHTNDFIKHFPDVDFTVFHNRK